MSKESITLSEVHTNNSGPSISILILLINYNNKIEVLNHSKKIHQVDEISVAVLNNGGDKSQWITEDDLVGSKVTIVSSNKNLGYLNGANFLLSKVDTTEIFDFVILCNTDIEYSLGILVSKLNSINIDKTESALVYGPNLIDRNGNYQNPFFIKKPTKLHFVKWSIFYSNPIFFKIYIKFSEYKKKNKLKTNYATIQNVFAVHGAFMIFTREFFSLGGSLEYHSFLFGEELYIGFMVNQILNRKIKVIPDFLVNHNEHTTTEKLSSNFRRKCLQQSIKNNYREIYR